MPFSKENVDKIIERGNISSKESIQYVVKDSNYRCGGYTYTQFTEYNFEECLDAMRTNYGPAEYQRQKRKEQQKQKELLKNNKQYS